ncbi:hypothetical protein VNO77_16875 [Canavalia gladiata]|uniref:Transmembrane protein n=1 Tax=Canavalia gladiata TaxID=3824 RepID=A0AAN9LMT7_CANGL
MVEGQCCWTWKRRWDCCDFRVGRPLDMEGLWGASKLDVNGRGVKAYDGRRCMAYGGSKIMRTMVFFLLLGEDCVHGKKGYGMVIAYCVMGIGYVVGAVFECEILGRLGRVIIACLGREYECCFYRVNMRRRIQVNGLFYEEE